VSSGETPGRQTVETTRRALAIRLKSGGIDSAELDARLLVGAVLGLDLTGLITAANRTLTPDDLKRLHAFAMRRLSGEPVARILGHKEFWGLPFRLSSATLVPRPDTETVVELALESFQKLRGSGAKPRIADLGTGSGAILLALLHEIPDAFGVGTDISVEALRTASRNAAGLGLGKRAVFIACHYGAALRGGFDLIVSNPPYVRSADIPGLAVEVRDHDPHAALDGGADGLDAYRVLILQAADLLSPGGALIVEAGQGQSGPIAGLMTTAGLITHEAAKTDLAGIPRAVLGRKPSR
jgi:release factor glutamine methyltransferase